LSFLDQILSAEFISKISKLFLYLGENWHKLTHIHETIFFKMKMFSYFFQHLAYGLSGMYSSLPRKLEGPNFTDSSWYRLSNMDLSHLPDVVKFLATLGTSHCYFARLNPIKKGLSNFPSQHC
jgi:hypothetical protein